MKNQGFTLIEVAIAITVLGILLVPMLAVFDMEIKRMRIENSGNRLFVLQGALERYVAANGAYPLPAPRGVGEGDPRFGHAVNEENYGGFDECRGDDEDVCETPGAKGTGQSVLIGDFPFATVGLPVNFIVDGYGGKFTYAVSKPVTQTGFSDSDGEIGVIDRTGNTFREYDRSPAPEPVPGLDVMAHYVLVSHGRDGRGAYSLSGRLIARCENERVADAENCNGDSVFNSNYDSVTGLTNPDGTPQPDQYVRMQSMANNEEYYDDFLLSSATVGGFIWSLSLESSNVFNRNTGNIRIGSNIGTFDTEFTPPGGIPLAEDWRPEKGRIEVWGNVRTGTLFANRICTAEQEEKCRVGADLGGGIPTQGGVFTPAVLGGFPPTNPPTDCDPDTGQCAGYGIRCLGGYGMTGLHQADEVCSLRGFPPDMVNANLFLTNLPGSPTSGNSCNTGLNYFASGFENGQIQCTRW